MTLNKKTIISASTILGAAVLATGGTIAYFTDHKTELNRFTVGDVAINLYESQLHRQNSGRQGSFGALASDPNYCDWNANENDSNLDSNTGLIKGSYDKARYCTPNMNANEGNSSSISAVANGHTRTGFSNANRTWGPTPPLKPMPPLIRPLLAKITPPLMATSLPFLLALPQVNGFANLLT